MKYPTIEKMRDEYRISFNEPRRSPDSTKVHGMMTTI